MTCDVEGFICNGTRYKTLHLCPIKKGDTFPPLKVEANIIRDDVKTPMDIDEVVFQVYKYGKKEFTLPTIVRDGVVVVGEVEGEVTNNWSKVVYTYEMTFTLKDGRVVSYLSGNFPVI